MQMEAQRTSTSIAFTRQELVDLYDQYSPKLYRYAFHLLGDIDLAEECVAETFSRFLHALQAGRGPQDHIQAYLYRIAHNWITDSYRRRPEEPLHEEMPADPVHHNPVTLVMHRLEHEQVRSALYRLTQEQRQVVVLRFLEDWSHDEIARVIGKTAEATRALQHRALAALRGLLQESAQE